MITINLPPEQRARLRGLLRRAGPREIGGILMGEQIAPDHFRVVDFSADETTGSAVHFVRNSEQHTQALESFFQQTNCDFRRFNYLGEWHSHPRFPTLPSYEDIGSMQSLVNGERDIAFACLLIVRLRGYFFLETSARMFIRNGAMLPVEVTRSL
jgi:proteasome lid subunit RPN8/RPN11